MEKNQNSFNTHFNKGFKRNNEEKPKHKSYQDFKARQPEPKSSSQDFKTQQGEHNSSHHVKPKQENQKSFQHKKFHKKKDFKKTNYKQSNKSDSKKNKARRFSSNEFSPFLAFQPESTKYPYPKLLQKGVLRVIPLGGCQEIGKNCILIEYDDSMIILDIGLQFPTEIMHGINYVIPDMNYVYKHKHKLKAIFITHGHYDHTGGIPHVMENFLHIPIYTKALTAAMIKRKQAEMGEPLNIKEIKTDDIIIAGQFKVEFYHVNHTIPDCVSVVIHTPLGTIIDTGDWKEDPKPIGEEPISWDRIADIKRKHNILALFADSTAAYKPGHQLSESEIINDLEVIFRDAPGRIILGTFASLITRIQQMIWFAEKYGRKIVVDGRSMKTNVEIAKQLQKIKYDDKIFISLQEAKKYPDNKIVITCTGAQGEQHASLMRIATKRHRFIEFQKGDSVIFSSSVVPGNEQSVQMLMDMIYRGGAKVFHYKQLDIHAGGHGHSEETIKLYDALKPKYYIPVHGNHSLLVQHAEKIEEHGMPRSRIFIPDNGQPIEFYPDGTAALTKTSTGNKMVAVDGLGVGDIGPLVLQERENMRDNGVFVVILTIDKKTKQLRTSPDIISRGFIFMKSNEKLVNDARNIARLTYERNKGLVDKDIMQLKNIVKDAVDDFIYNTIEREPVILPVIIQV